MTSFNDPLIANANPGEYSAMPVIVLRNRFTDRIGPGPLYAATADFHDIDWPLFASITASNASKFYKFVTSCKNAKETLVERLHLNLLPTRRGAFFPLGFYEHLHLDAPRFVQGTHARFNNTNELVIIKRILKKSNGEITRIILDNDVTCTKDDITLVSQATPGSMFRRHSGRGMRYGTIVAFFTYTDNEAFLIDKVSHMDICRVMHLVYSGLASKVIFVAQSWKMFDTLLNHEMHTKPLPCRYTDTLLERLGN